MQLLLSLPPSVPWWSLTLARIEPTGMVAAAAGDAGPTVAGMAIVAVVSASAHRIAVGVLRRPRVSNRSVMPAP